MSTPTNWKCRDGRVLLITDMDTEHLKSASEMLRRKGAIGVREAARCFLGPPPQGEHAMDAWESELMNLTVSRHLDALEAELARRSK